MAKPLKAGQWKVVWTENPVRRIAIVPRTEPKPEWAAQEAVPDTDHWMMEDVACRQVLRLFVVQWGWEADQVDDAMGQGIAAWAANPQRLSWKEEDPKEVKRRNRRLARQNDLRRQAGLPPLEPEKPLNELMHTYNAVRHHLSQGLPLRMIPIRSAEIVYQTFGAEVWAHVIEREHKLLGPFPPEWRDLIGDLWCMGIPNVPMPDLTPGKTTVAAPKLRKPLLRDVVQVH